MRKSLITLTFLLIATLIGCSGNGSGGSTDYTAQQAVVESGYQYLTSFNWTEYAKVMHPASLRDFRQMLLPGIQKLVSNTQGDSIQLFNQSYHAVEIQSMPPDSFFVQMMTLMETLTPEFRNTYSNIQASVLGTVAESDTMVHVVSRTTMMFGLQPVSEMEVHTVRLSEGEWRFEPTNKITGIVMILRQGMPQ